MSFSSQHHSFDIKLAAMYGIEKAILIHHFQHWIRLNRFKGKNIIDGTCWSYQTKESIAATFPYFTYDSVRHHLDGLIEMKILKVGCFNKSKFDKTLWYAFECERAFGVDDFSIKEFYTKGENPRSQGKSNFSCDEGKTPDRAGENPRGSGENPRPIPDTKKKMLKKDKNSNVPDSGESPTKEAEESSEASKMARYLLMRRDKLFPKMKQPRIDGWIKDLDLMNRKDGRSWEEIKTAIDFAMEDAFWCKNILSADKLRSQYDKLYAKMTPVENIGSFQEKNREISINIKNYLIKNRNKCDMQIFKNKIYIPHKNEDLLLSMNPEEFEKILMKIYGLTKD